MTKRTILGVFAHPDDESMGPGATLARYAAAGHRVAVVIATDGGAGRLHAERPSDEAGRAELMKLSGVGPGTADRIISYRQAHGPFRRLQDLSKVEGVGKGVLERNAGEEGKELALKVGRFMEMYLVPRGAGFIAKTTRIYAENGAPNRAAMMRAAGLTHDAPDVWGLAFDFTKYFDEIPYPDPLLRTVYTNLLETLAGLQDGSVRPIAQDAGDSRSKPARNAAVAPMAAIWAIAMSTKITSRAITWIPR